MFRPACLLLLGFACLGPAAMAADPPDDAVLTSKGLRRAGAYYTLPVEAEVGKLGDSLRALQKGLSVAVIRQREIDAEAENNKRMVVAFTQQRLELRQQLPQASTVDERNQIVGTMNDLGDRINLLVEGTDEMMEAKKQAAAAVAARREAFLQGVLDLSNLVEETDKKYAELAADPEVIAALKAINEKSKVKYVLGPSHAYQNHVKALKRAQAAVQSEAIPLTADHGTYLVDVTLNGKVSKAMVFDTGASVVSLPADLAKAAGLTPKDTDPTIKLQIADGSIHQAKLMTLKSVRVGKFTVENVECAVMPPDLNDAPPLLGGSFLKNFTYKLVPESGLLTLSKVATPEAEKAATPRATATKKGARRKGR